MGVYLRCVLRERLGIVDNVIVHQLVGLRYVLQGINGILRLVSVFLLEEVEQVPSFHQQWRSEIDCSLHFDIISSYLILLAKVDIGNVYGERASLYNRMLVSLIKEPYSDTIK